MAFEGMLTELGKVALSIAFERLFLLYLTIIAGLNSQGGLKLALHPTSIAFMYIEKSSLKL